MNKTMGWFVACSLGLFACNVESYDDCPKDDFGDEYGGHYSKAGASSKAGTSAGGGAADAGEGGAGAAPSTPTPVACTVEHDCPAGYNCNLDAHQCKAADEETCGELTTEAACTHRTDCTPVYAGTNCSCGKDCECKGGEPGCVCESFEFFVCKPLE